MATPTTQTPTVRVETKSSKKKKAKADTTSTSTPAAPTPTDERPPNGAPESENGDGTNESPYIKELRKNIRNVNKKITNASKVDNILAENPQLTLDELVAARKINADQKAQILKKPALQASLVQLEEQIAQYEKFEQEYKVRSQAEKADFERTFKEQATKDLEDAVSAAKAEAAATALKDQESNLLVLSQFLRLAAARRADDPESVVEENVALEGVLVEIYNGDKSAVAAMTKLINGSEDATSSIGGDKLSVTYAQVKSAAVGYKPAIPTEGVADEIYTSTVETTEHPVPTEPTIADAGLPEIESLNVSSEANGHDAVPSPLSTPQNSGLGDGAANAVGESQWEAGNDMTASQEWVEVSRDGTDPDSGLSAAPAPAGKSQDWTPATQSWADDQPETPPVVDATSGSAANANDGFHKVQRSRGNRDGQYRGRGGRGGDNGGYGGRGNFRGGDSGYRGRGRGAPRGGAGSAPRARKPDES